MEDSLKFYINSMYSEEERKLFNNLSNVLQILHKNRTFQLFHFITTSVNKYRFNLYYKPIIDFCLYNSKQHEVNTLKVIPVHNEHWRSDCPIYITSNGFDLSKNVFEIRIELKFSYYVEMNYNGEFLVYDNYLKNGFNENPRYIQYDSRTFQLFCKHWRRFTPKYSKFFEKLDQHID